MDGIISQTTLLRVLALEGNRLGWRTEALSWPGLRLGLTSRPNVCAFRAGLLRIEVVLWLVFEGPKAPLRCESVWRSPVGAGGIQTRRTY